MSSINAFLAPAPAQAASRPTLSVNNHLEGLANYDEWHFELTTIVLRAENLSVRATKCADVETVWSTKGLVRALRVLTNDIKKLRAHHDAVKALPHGAPQLPPPVLDPLLQLTDAVKEYLDEHRSTDLVTARSERATIEQLYKEEVAAVDRACALVYASLSPGVLRDAAAVQPSSCAHCIIEWLRGKFCSEEQKSATTISFYTKVYDFKFERHSSLDAHLNRFDKLVRAVEKADSVQLSGNFLASALLHSLPPCIEPDLYVWRGSRPSLPYAELRPLLVTHWPELTGKYPSFLGPKPDASSGPVHGTGPTPETTRSSALQLSAPPTPQAAPGYGNPFRSGRREAERQARGFCDYCSMAGHTTYECTKLSRAFHQHAVRHDFQYPPGWVAIPPGQLPQPRKDGGGPRRHQGGSGGGRPRQGQGRSAYRSNQQRGYGGHGGYYTQPPDLGTLVSALQDHLGGQHSGSAGHHYDRSRSPDRSYRYPRSRSRDRGHQQDYQYDRPGRSRSHDRGYYANYHPDGGRSQSRGRGDDSQGQRRSSSRQRSQSTHRAGEAHNDSQQDSFTYSCVHSHTPASPPRLSSNVTQPQHISFSGLTKSTDRSSTNAVLSTLLKDFSPHFDSLDDQLSRSLLSTTTGWALRVSPTSPVVHPQLEFRHWTVDSGASKHSTFRRVEI